MALYDDMSSPNPEVFELMNQIRFNTDLSCRSSIINHSFTQTNKQTNKQTINHYFCDAQKIDIKQDKIERAAVRKHLTLILVVDNLFKIKYDKPNIKHFFFKKRKELSVCVYFPFLF